MFKSAPPGKWRPLPKAASALRHRRSPNLGTGQWKIVGIQCDIYIYDYIVYICIYIYIHLHILYNIIYISYYILYNISYLLYIIIYIILLNQESGETNHLCAMAFSASQCSSGSKSPALG